ncbi:MAG TPA: 50S ribosomal protein L19, partial [Moraxellaceae bacterium]|nr:50S ribosomal protein L19 [Moraxellaceae bacterium]
MSGKHPLVQAVEQSQLKQNLPSFAPGDTVIVQVKVKEGDRERL